MEEDGCSHITDTPVTRRALQWASGWGCHLGSHSKSLQAAQACFPQSSPSDKQKQRECSRGSASGLGLLVAVWPGVAALRSGNGPCLGTGLSFVEDGGPPGRKGILCGMAEAWRSFPVHRLGSPSPGNPWAEGRSVLMVSQRGPWGVGPVPSALCPQRVLGEVTRSWGWAANFISRCAHPATPKCM